MRSTDSSDQTRLLVALASFLMFMIGGTPGRGDSAAGVPTTFIGNANGNPPVEKKPVESIGAAFCTRGPAPKRGSMVTVVSSDPSLPAVTTRVGTNAKDEHDRCIAVQLEPIVDRKWLEWRPPSGAHAWHQRVMILVGTVPKARAVPNASVGGDELPPGTRKAQDLILAVDLDEGWAGGRRRATGLPGPQATMRGVALR